MTVKVEILGELVEVPDCVRPVVECIVLSDFDVPNENTATAISWLRDRGWAREGRGKFPVVLTREGKDFAKLLGVQLADGCKNVSIA